MTLSPERQSRLTELIDALCDGAITPEQAARLEEELLHDREAQWFYLRHVHLFGGLLWDCEARSEWQALSQLKTQDPTAAPAINDSQPTALPPLGEADSPLPFSLLGGAAHGTVGSFWELAPLSYLVARCCLAWRC